MKKRVVNMLELFLHSIYVYCTYMLVSAHKIRASETAALAAGFVTWVAKCSCIGESFVRKGLGGGHGASSVIVAQYLLWRHMGISAEGNIYIETSPRHSQTVADLVGRQRGSASP